MSRANYMLLLVGCLLAAWDKNLQAVFFALAGIGGWVYAERLEQEAGHD